MKDLKFEIIIPYYKRPQMVLNALRSVKELTYDNWHLTLIDDSGDNSFKETFENYGFKKEKIFYIPINMKDEEKQKIGGSIFGKYMNDCIKNTDAEIIITLCDDDALMPNYLTDLNKFYNENPNEVWAYCHVKFFNPELEEYEKATEIPWDTKFNTSQLNIYTERIFPPCRVDSSQVSFRKVAFTLSNQWWPYPQTRDLDRSVFEKFSSIWGTCPFANCFGQYKGWFQNQLGYRHKINKTDWV